MELTIQDLGAVGELAGGIIVIISVAYLAIQTKQSNRHAEAATELEFINGLNEILNRRSFDRNTDVLQRGFSQFSELTNADKAVFHMQVGSLVNQCLTAKHLYERRLLPEETANAAEDVLVMVLSTPGGLMDERSTKIARPRGDGRAWSWMFIRVSVCRGSRHPSASGQRLG